MAPTMTEKIYAINPEGKGTGEKAITPDERKVVWTYV